MSVTVRLYRLWDTGHGQQRKSWEVDIQILRPDGSAWRERKKAPVTSRSAALRWGQARERAMLLNGSPTIKKEVPTLEAFAVRFIDGYARANRHKPSGIAAKETILRVHLIPQLGPKALDEITTEDVQELKTALHEKSPKTVNNVLATLSRMLSVAVEWGVIEALPCTVKQLKTPRPAVAFHDFEDFERLVTSAKAVNPNAYLITLLGGEAGLRCGEMMALEWSDVNLGKRQLCVRRSEWKGHVTEPKGGRLRYVPMTARLLGALRQHRHLRGQRVLVEQDGRSLTQKMVQDRVRWAARRAQVPAGVHILRHTFCSHLSMRGAPVRAIQELAGHQDLSTTLRYMHLSPAAIEGAIRLLDQRAPGEILEKKKTSVGNYNE
jgi:integrase